MNPKLALRVVARYQRTAADMTGRSLDDRIALVSEQFYGEMMREILKVVPAHLKSEAAGYNTDWGGGYQEPAAGAMCKGYNKADAPSKLHIWVSDRTVILRYEDKDGRKASTKMTLRSGEINEANPFVARWTSGF